MPFQKRAVPWPLLLAALSLSFGPNPPADAAQVTFWFTGQLTFADTGFTANEFGNGLISGSYTFDDTVPDTGLGGSGLFNGTLTRLSFQIGGGGNDGSWSAPAAVTQNFISSGFGIDFLGTADAYALSLRSGAFTGDPGPLTSNGLPVEWVEIDLRNSNLNEAFLPGALNNCVACTLPSAPPDVSVLGVGDDNALQLYYGFGVGRRRMEFELTSLSNIPLPATWLLFAGGAALLARRRR